jgi:Acetyltransferases, including N-acetylases of ribosomal proteins
MKEAASIFLRADIGTKDGYNLARWVRNEHVTRYLNEGAAAAQEVTELLESTPAYMLTYHFNQSGPFYMVCDGEDRSIGFVRLCRRPGGRYEVVYAIGEERLWGNGFGRRALSRALDIAFCEKRAEAVDARIDRENVRSVRAAVHCGMREVRAWERLSEYSLTREGYLTRALAGAMSGGRKQ